MKKALSLLILLSVVLWADHSGTIQFMTGDGKDINLIAPLSKVYVKLTDSDMNTDTAQQDNVSISVSSSKEPVAERLILTETSTNSGVFVGSMQVAEGTALVDKQIQADRASFITVSYEDAATAYGTSAVIVNSIEYGITLLSDTISTDRTLSKEGSPYRGLNNVVVEKNALLTITEGVEIEFIPSGNFSIKGSLVANGTEEDSISILNGSISLERYCDSLIMSYVSCTGPSTVVSLSSSCNDIKVVLDHCNLRGRWCTLYFPREGQYENSFFSFTHSYLRLHEDLFLGKNSSLFASHNQISSSLEVVWLETSGDEVCNISNNMIKHHEDSGGIGIAVNLPSEIKECTISENNFFQCPFGIDLKGITDSVIVEKNNFEKYGYCAIKSNGGIIRYNNFHEAKGRALWHTGSKQADVPENYWGEATTALMEAGPNPQNIPAILDRYDSIIYGEVLYNNWLPEPYIEQSLAIEKEPQNCTAVEGETARFMVKTIGGTIGSVSYQWYYDGEVINGAKAATYIFTASEEATRARYYCVITDGTTTVTTGDAYLTLTPKITVEIDTTFDSDTALTNKKDTVITEVITITKVTTIPQNYIVAIAQVAGKSQGSRIAFAPNPAPAEAQAITFVIPEGKSGEWTVAIYDVLGNEIDRQVFDAEVGDIFQWDLRNKQGARVAAGSYLAVVTIRFEDQTEEQQIHSVGVSR